MPRRILTYYYSYYGCTMLFCCICSGIAVYIGFSNKKKFSALKLFYIYPLASLLQIAIAIFLYPFVKRQIYKQVSHAAINIFMVTEFLLIFNFFKHVLESKAAQFIISIIAVTYFIVISIEWFALQYFYNFPVDLFAVQAICILVPAFYYFFDLFKRPTKPNLLKDFSFWVSLSIIFYFSCTLPLFLLKDFAYKKDGIITEANLYSINFICYGIMFLLITKAYLCPKTEAPN